MFVIVLLSLWGQKTVHTLTFWGLGLRLDVWSLSRVRIKVRSRSGSGLGAFKVHLNVGLQEMKLRHFEVLLSDKTKFCVCVKNEE